MRRFLHLLRDTVVALLAVTACVAVYRFGIMTLLQRIITLSDLQITSLRRIGVTASLFFGYWVIAKYYERRIITEFTFRPIDITISAFFGISLIGITLLSLYGLNNYQVLSFRGFSLALPIMGMIFLGVIFEEVVFRGIIFRLLEKHAGTVKALFAQSLLFGGLHMFNDSTSAVTAISVTLIGAFWAVIYVYSRNLWVVIANHFAWNLTIFIAGAPLSGQEEWRLSAPFETSYQGPTWLTGGGFGPEDSIINILVIIGALVGLAYLARQRNRFIIE